MHKVNIYKETLIKIFREKSEFLCLRIYPEVAFKLPSLHVISHPPFPPSIHPLTDPLRRKKEKERKPAPISSSQF